MPLICSTLIHLVGMRSNKTLFLEIILFMEVLTRIDYMYVFMSDIMHCGMKSIHAHAQV